ncbi:MAG: DUF1844 domain-containing protein [Candidatus Omnitrophica bacterium]|nr:DUF1844 domain-containing protein [Candidatus Omnitrophota bacterium]
MEENEKKIDESWKERAEKEKQEHATGNINNMPEPDFKLFLSSLGMQALIALGELENPVTNKKELELNQAKYLIDIIGVLKDKTRNNLDKDEEGMLENLLYQLRTLYVTKSK